MAFGKAKFGSKNPTGDKSFNKITKHVFGPSSSGAKDDASDNDADDSPAPPSKGATLSGGKAKGKGGGMKYDGATNAFKRC